MPKDQLADCLAYNNLKGLILSKALKAQKDAEDEGTRIGFANLRSEVIDLRHRAEEKEDILTTLASELNENRAKFKEFSEEKNKKILELEDEKKHNAKRILDLEAMLAPKAESHGSEMLELKGKFDEVNEQFEVEKSKREIAEAERDRIRKNVDELWESKEQCFSIAAQCCEKLKSMFASVGAFSSDERFVRGDAEGAIKWIEGEIKAFDEVLTGRGDFCACMGARGAVSLLEKAGCEHVKSVIRPEFKVSASDIKDPSAEAVELGGKFYSDIWLAGGRQMADEAVRDSEGKAHRVAEATKKAEEASRLEKLREPYNPKNDPELKDFLAELEVVHKTIDEAVDKVLNDIAKRVLNED